MQPGGPDCGPPVRSALSGCLLTSFADCARALDDITRHARKAGISGILTTNEYLTPLAARAGAALGLPGNDPALADAARDKAEMNRQFARRGVLTPRTHLVVSEAGLQTLIGSGLLAFPWMVKPALGAGSSGVTVVTDAGAAAAAFKAARGTRPMYGIASGPQALAQELVAGTEYSIESFTQDGTTTHLCATRKLTSTGAHRAELGHGLPARLTPERQRAAFRQASLAITATGIRNGPSHTELIITPGGECVVIEAAARIAAGQIGHLIRHALGIDPWAACLDIALGHPARLTAAHAGYAAVRFLTAPRQGRLTAITGLPPAGPRVPVVRVRANPGDLVRPATDNAARLGSIVVTGPDQATADDHADRIMAQVQIEVQAGPGLRE